MTVESLDGNTDIDDNIQNDLTLPVSKMTWYGKTWHRMTRIKSEEQIRKEIAENEGKGKGLKKVLSFPYVVLFGIANVVGAGIFIMPGEIAAGDPEKGILGTGAATFICFILAAIACALSGICYVDFSARIPSSGGAYTYVYASLGEYLAWIAGLGLTLGASVSAAASARGCAQYLRSLLSKVFKVESLPSVVQQHVWVEGVVVFDLIPGLLCLIVALIALVGARESSIANSVLTSINLALILLCSVVGFIYLDPSLFDDFVPNGATSILSGTSLAVFCYIGWDSICVLSEEVKNPHKVIPRAIATSLAVISTLYCCMAVVLCGLIPTDAMQSEGAAPFYWAFSNRGLQWVAIIVSVGAVCCSANACFGSSSAQPRAWYGISRDGLLPAPIQRVYGPKQTPVIAIICTACVSIPLAMFITFSSIADAISAGSLVMQALVCVGCLVRRASNKNCHRMRSLKLLVTAISLLSVICGLVLQINSRRETSLMWMPISIVSLYLVGVIALVIVCGFSLFKDLAVPLLALTMNFFFTGNLGLRVCAQILVLYVIVSIGYFAYGMRHSTMNETELDGSEAASTTLSFAYRDEVEVKTT